MCVCVCSQASRSRATLSCDSSYFSGFLHFDKCLLLLTVTLRGYLITMVIVSFFICGGKGSCQLLAKLCALITGYILNGKKPIL